MNKPLLDNISNQSLLDQIINLAFEKKAEGIITLDLRGLSSSIHSEESNLNKIYEKDKSIKLLSW